MIHDNEKIEEIANEQEWSVVNTAKKYLEYNIAKNRNSLGSVVTLIEMLRYGVEEDGLVLPDHVLSAMKSAKRSVNKIAHRTVFK